jgi:putative NIF3 family GTP cyclohydrolase 1 type 2
MNTWFYLKIKEGQVKETVEKGVNIILVHHGRGTWPARSIKKRQM